MTTKEYEKNLINHILKKILKHDGKKLLTSIIITGSFGRYEPTYNFKKDGTFKLKSDVEIALVYKSILYKHKLEKIIEDISNEFEEDLNLMLLSNKRVKKRCNFNNSFIIPKYKTLFTYDLYNGSYTIWGEKSIENKSILLDEVDLYESKRIVGNRIGELIYLQINENDKKNKEFLLSQWKGKLMLAVGSAWLLLNNCYVSSYTGQFEEIKKNFKKITNCFDKKFYENYKKTFLFLRKSGDFFEISDEELKKYVLSIYNIMNEMKIKKTKVNSYSRKLKYIIKYIKKMKRIPKKNFENIILDNLLKMYINNDNKILNVAKEWHDILY